MTNIEWTDKTWNPVAGCARVSEGCRNCYAEVMAARHVLMSRAHGRESPYLPVVDAERRRWTRRFITLPERLADPLSWRKPARVFVNSMSDLFGEGVPFEFVAAVFGVMAATPRHTYQVLTKRPARMLEFFAWIEEKAPKASLDGHRKDLCTIKAMDVVVRDADLRRLSWGGNEAWPLPNVWLGVSVEDQRAADERIPLLLQAPAAVRFLSCEPLLGPVDLSPWLFADGCNDIDEAPPKSHCSGCGERVVILRGAVTCGCCVEGPEPADVTPLDWIIVGGESGPNARSCHVSWVRAIVRQGAEAKAPVFVKQFGARPDFITPLAGGGQTIESMLRHGEYDPDPIVLDDRKGGDPSEWPEDLRVRQWPREVMP